MFHPTVLKPALPWQSHPREATIALVAGAVALLALGGTTAAMPTLGNFAQPSVVAEKAPAVTSATQLRDVAPEVAVKLNAAIPLTGDPGDAARPFLQGKASASARAQALECLASAVYYEAGQESDEGQRAVAQVILNRVRHPAFPNSVCGVVYQGSTRQTGCQFTFTCDGSLARAPMRGAWDRARSNAAAMLAGAVYAPVGQATHYHANYVLPYWASSLAKTQVVGAHLFYRWAGNWGRPAAFVQAYAGREASAAALRLAALAVPHVLPKVLIEGSSAAVAALDAKPGVAIEGAKGGRVTAHFSPAAREAVEKVKVVPYVERVSASDNLRYALGDSAAASGGEQAFGRAPAEPSKAAATPAS
jgi:spore germination cell wall hydrolase CwlJ-like protein